ncbi:hypothetical protein R69746_07542 [Paraburkholderia aspalathi]|nr:hypothetical protein R69746_07542 [Paraburkholderia aspalathi]
MDDLLRLCHAAAVYYRIIGITRKGALREVPLHPCVERVVHEQIHQHRADHPTLRCTSRSWQSRPICSLERRSQPSVMPISIRTSWIDVQRSTRLRGSVIRCAGKAPPATGSAYMPYI